LSNSDKNYIVNVETVPGLIKFAGFIYKENIFGVTHYRYVNSCPQGHYYYFYMFKSFLCTEFKDNLSFKCLRSNNSFTNNCDSDQPFLVEYVKIKET